MGRDDHYVFMDGCIVKGCRVVLDFDRTFGEYADLLEDLFRRGGWGRGERHLMGLPLPIPLSTSFGRWADTHVHAAQSTQNIRTGASRVDEILRSIAGHANIHLFGTSAAGAAILEYFLLTDPDNLYYRPGDLFGTRKPAKRYKLDVRIASLTAIDAPTNWVRLREDHGPAGSYFGRGSLGRYLASHTRIKAGPGVPQDKHTTRLEDVPNTWVEARPVAGLDYDDRPHYARLPGRGLERHAYTGSHMSRETREFLNRVWR